MRTKYQATGTDMIPNKDFWFNFPILVKVKLLFSWFSCPSSEVIA